MGGCKPGVLVWLAGIVFLFGCGFQSRAQETVLADSLKNELSVGAQRFSPGQLVLPASLIAVGAFGTAVNGMNDFHLLSRRDSVSQVRIDDYM